MTQGGEEGKTHAGIPARRVPEMFSHTVSVCLWHQMLESKVSPRGCQSGTFQGGTHGENFLRCSAFLVAGKDWL